MLVISMYTYQKAEVLMLRKDVDVLQTVKESYYSTDYVFSYENGFNIAVAFTAYDSNPEPILDPTYGEIVYNHYKWGPDVGENDTYGSKRLPLKSHQCTSTELGLDDDRSQSKFLPTFRDGIDEVRFYQKKFVCAEQEDLKVSGDFNSYKA